MIRRSLAAILLLTATCLVMPPTAWADSAIRRTTIYPWNIRCEASNAAGQVAQWYLSGFSSGTPFGYIDVLDTDGSTLREGAFGVQPAVQFSEGSLQASWDLVESATQQEAGAATLDVGLARAGNSTTSGFAEHENYWFTFSFTDQPVSLEGVLRVDGFPDFPVTSCAGFVRTTEIFVTRPQMARVSSERTELLCRWETSFGAVFLTGETFEDVWQYGVVALASDESFYAEYSAVPTPFKWTGQPKAFDATFELEPSQVDANAALSMTLSQSNEVVRQRSGELPEQTRQTVERVLVSGELILEIGAQAYPLPLESSCSATRTIRVEMSLRRNTPQE